MPVRELAILWVATCMCAEGVVVLRHSSKSRGQLVAGS